jgi:hypothetical protein
MSHRLRRLLVAVDLVLVVAAVAVLLVWTPQPSAAEATFTIHKVDDATFTPPNPRTDPFFVLLIGNDGRAGLEGVRAGLLHEVLDARDKAEPARLAAAAWK